MTDIAYTWLLDDLVVEPECAGLTDVVRQVPYTLSAYAKGEKPQIVSGVLALGEPDPEKFIPYEKLTRDDVLAWLQSGVDVAAYKADLGARLFPQPPPKLETKVVPWVNG